MKRIDMHVVNMLGENEAILEITNEDVSLLVFCHPYTSCMTRTDMILHAFLACNIMQEESFSLPIKTDGLFSYHITAKVLNASLRSVCVNDIQIILDIPLPKDISNGSFVSFDAMRLDWNP